MCLQCSAEMSRHGQHSLDSIQCRARCTSQRTESHSFMSVSNSPTARLPGSNVDLLSGQTGWYGSTEIRDGTLSERIRDSVRSRTRSGFPSNDEEALTLRFFSADHRRGDERTNSA